MKGGKDGVPVVENEEEKRRKGQGPLSDLSSTCILDGMEGSCEQKEGKEKPCEQNGGKERSYEHNGGKISNIHSLSETACSKVMEDQNNLDINDHETDIQEAGSHFHQNGDTADDLENNINDLELCHMKINGAKLQTTFDETEENGTSKDQEYNPMTDSASSHVSISVVEEQIQEDIPLGTDAQHYTGIGTTEENQPIDKRLLWLQGHSENASFSSDLSHNTTASNSSDISLDMLLQERSTDPEEVLTNLGFISGTEASDKFSRVPNRFLSNRSAADGVDIKSLLDDNEQLLQILNLSEQEELIEHIQQSQQNMSSQDHPQLGSMFASVMSGMRFLSAISPNRNFSLSQDSKSDNDSILQNPRNREFLEKQGYYSRYNTNTKSTTISPKTANTSEGKFARLSKTMSLDASERRKKFHQTRSKNLSLIEGSPEEWYDRGSIDDSKMGVVSRSYTSFDTSDSFDSAEFNDSRDSAAEVFTYPHDDGITQRPSVSLGDISPGLMLSRDRFAEGSMLRSSDEVEPDEKSPTVPRTKAYNKGLQKIAHLRRHQVDRFMSMQDDDEDYVVSPASSPGLSKEPSLEKTLTASDIHKLQKKSSTLRAESTTSIDVDVERDLTPVPSPKAVTFKLRNSVEDSENVNDIVADDNKNLKTDKDKDMNSNVKVDLDEDSLDGTPDASQKMGGVKATPSIELSQSGTSREEMDGMETLGGMGRMESIHSDSSGFAEGDVVLDNVQEERVSSLGSSVESDQTFKSVIIVQGDQPHSPRDFTEQKGQKSHPEKSLSSKKVDIAVGTDDINFEEIQTNKQEVTMTPGGNLVDSRVRTVSDKIFSSSVSIAPTITYQLHQREKESDLDMSGTEQDNSVVLTIELPQEWLQGGTQEKPPKSSVVSTLYKHIGPPDKATTYSGNDQSKPDSHPSTSNWISSHSSSQNRPEYSDSLKSRRQSYKVATRTSPLWSSTPSIETQKRKVPKLSENLNRSQIVSPKRTYFTKIQENNSQNSEPRRKLYKSQDDLRPLSPSSVSDADELIFPIKPRDHISYLKRAESDASQDTSFLDRSEVTLFSPSESCLSLSGENMEYIKLLKLVNKPGSEKRTSSAVQCKPKNNVKCWNQLDRKDLLAEEINLLKSALTKYKIELNSMEMVFRIKNKMAAGDLTPEEKSEIEQLCYIWEEVRREIAETEQLLDNRLSGLHIGNDNFNLMLAMDIIHSMTELLKEQLFQHQVCVDVPEDGTPQPQRSSPWQPDTSQPMWGIPGNDSQNSSLFGDTSIHESLLELRESILNEVRQERQEMQWLHRELKNKDKELSSLRQEVISHNVKAGMTRKKIYYESDV